MSPFFKLEVFKLEAVCVFVLQRSCPDVKAEMFELLFQILHQNWRFFFKTLVLNSVQRTGAEEHMENEAQFIAAMQVHSAQTF